MRCCDCGYYHKEEEDRFPRCHFDEWNLNCPGADRYAPCEEEEFETWVDEEQ